jgi:hypothetical protein
MLDADDDVEACNVHMRFVVTIIPESVPLEIF